ncbi:hypothetical protein [Polaromonas sp. JS666]|uniref:hypothetical protein n=1 Tax=Polaromonas sp. (strain JS666 / ATCC BAA-500) TaxID=296591 RepID=UPI0000464312|nr:hypothetical protein [Polaromonas sp. JS666]
MNAAAVCGLLVAFVPERLNNAQVCAFSLLAAIQASQQGQPPIHFTAAVMMFVLLGCVARFCANKTLAYLPQEHERLKERFRRR